jgi:HJR/Mrr/RecB family endonuclease
MKKCVEMCCKAGQQYSVQTFDQQLYAIAQQIKWSRPLEFQNHINMTRNWKINSVSSKKPKKRPRYVRGFSVFYFTSGNFVMCIFTA